MMLQQESYLIRSDLNPNMKQKVGIYIYISYVQHQGEQNLCLVSCFNWMIYLQMCSYFTGSYGMFTFGKFPRLDCRLLVRWYKWSMERTISTSLCAFYAGASIMEPVSDVNKKINWFPSWPCMEIVVLTNWERMDASGSLFWQKLERLQ